MDSDRWGFNGAFCAVSPSLEPRSFFGRKLEGLSALLAVAPAGGGQLLSAGADLSRRVRVLLIGELFGKSPSTSCPDVLGQEQRAQIRVFQHPVRRGRWA